MALQIWISFILAAFPQIHVKDLPSEISVESPTQLTVETAYPEGYQPVSGSLLQSIVQQNAPFPSTFTVLKESISEPQAKEGIISQTYHYTLQPRIVGKTSLLLNARFESEGRRLVYAFADPVKIEVLPAKVDPPPFPQAYVPGETVPIDYFGIRADLAKERGSASHAATIAEAVNARKIPWIELLLALLAAFGLAFWSYWRFVRPRKHENVFIVTRFGLMRTLSHLAKTDVKAEDFFQKTDELLKSYLRIPQSFTDEEMLAALQQQKKLNFESLQNLKHLQQISQRHKFSSYPEDKASFRKALDLIEKILM